MSDSSVKKINATIHIKLFYTKKKQTPMNILIHLFSPRRCIFIFYRMVVFYFVTHINGERNEDTILILKHGAVTD